MCKCCAQAPDAAALRLRALRAYLNTRQCAPMDTAHAILPPNPPSQSTHDNGSPGSEDDTSAINMIRLAEEARRSSSGGVAGAGLNGAREVTRV